MAECLPEMSSGPEANTPDDHVWPFPKMKYADIVQAVGVSFAQKPIWSQSMSRPGSRASRQCSPAQWNPTEVGSSSGIVDLPSTPPLAHGKAAKMYCHLEWLRSERQAEKERIRKLDICLSDSALDEKRARHRIVKTQELRSIHLRRAQEVEEMMQKLSNEMRDIDCCSSPHRLPLGSRSLPQLADAVCSPEESRASLSWKAAKSSEPGAPGDLRGAELGVLARSVQQAEQEQRCKTAPQMTAPAKAAKDMQGSPRLRRRRPQSQGVLSIQPPIKPSPAEESLRRDEARRRVREALKMRCGGSAATAFRKMNSNKTGRICHVDFADAVTRLGVDWQELTGMSLARELFALFDQQKHFVITFEDLFPGEDPLDKVRPSTPKFCRDYTCTGNYEEKSARWDPSDQEEVLRIARAMSACGDEAAEKRKWMRSTMRRLKTKGKSDARCREVVAAHLPRGSGPKDRDGVNLFTRQDLKNCKKVYTDNVNLPMRRMWKEVLSYKDQKKEQRRVYERLFAVTEGAISKQKEAASQLMSSSFLGPDSLLSKLRPPEDLAAKKIFLQFANGDSLTFAGFQQVLKVLLPGEDESSVKQKWTEAMGMLQQIAQAHRAAAKDKPGAQENTARIISQLEKMIAEDESINFEAFSHWWDAYNRMDCVAFGPGLCTTSAAASL